MRATRSLRKYQNGGVVSAEEKRQQEQRELNSAVRSLDPKAFREAIKKMPFPKSKAQEPQEPLKKKRGGVVKKKKSVKR
jgi:hypothetical protein